MNADAPNSPPTADVLASVPPPADLPAPPAPDAPPPPKPLAWPDWFRPFDLALGVFAVVLAFLMASFAARNADLWRHLAAGRLVTQFQYPFGGDPFTFTAEGRPWVNAHWLGEVVLYLLHSVDSSGAVAVGVKAIAFAAAIGLLLRLKKPGAPLWPWAVVAAAGAVAAGGFTHLRPQVFGLPVLAGILVVLYTADWAKGNKWRVPLVLGGLTALWANVDTFAFLSPLLVGLILLGDWLHPKVFGSKGDLPSADEPFRLAPPRDALLRALLLCAAGVLLNPTFLAAVFRDPVEAVAQLVPTELDWQAADDLKEDPDLSRYSHSALSGAYTSNPVLGKNPSGVFAIALWVAGAVAAGIGHRHGRLSHVLVWAVFTLLGAVIHARFVPYGVLVGVPFLAAHLNGFGRRVPPLDTLTAQQAQLALGGSRTGRVLCLLGLVALVVCALPGWLHPWNGTAAGRRSVGWKVEADPGLKRAAEVFAGWHADATPTTVKLTVYPAGGGAFVEQQVTASRGEVLAGTRGLNSHPDLGDYLAYFAPAQKSFVTSRYRLHRAELKELTEARRQIYTEWPRGGLADDKTPVQVGWLVPLADKYGLGFVSVVLVEPQTDAAAGLNVTALLNTRLGLGVTPQDEQRLSAPPWHLDGRLLVVGRTFSLTDAELALIEGRKSTPDLDRKMDLLRGWAKNNRVMTWDVAKEVFATRDAPPPPPAMTRGVGERSWVDDLLTVFAGPPPRPIGLDDARNRSSYADLLASQRSIRNTLRQQRWQQQVEAAGRKQNGLAVLGGPALASTFRLPQPPTADGPGEQEYALPFLIARSARDAHAADPTAAAAFLDLAAAFEKPLMPAADAPADLFGGSPLAPSEADLQGMTALRRALARLPAADKTDAENAPAAVVARLKLVYLYLRQGPVQPIVTNFRRTQQGIEPVIQPGPRQAYLDSVVSTLGELLLVVDALPADKLDAVANNVLPLWQAARGLCEQEFWVGFMEGLGRNRIPQAWWEKLAAGKFDDLLVESELLKKDDVGDWPAKFAEAAQAGNPPEDAVRGRLKRVHDVLTAVALRRKGRLPPVELPAQRFPAAVQSGLPELALRMVEGEQADKQAPIGATPADALRLMLWQGRAEDVQGYFAKEQEKTNDTRLSADAAALEKVKFRLLEFELAKLNGDYAKADGLYTELLATPVGDPPQGPSMSTVVYPDLWRAGGLRPLTEAELALLGKLLDARLPPMNLAVEVTGGVVAPWAVSLREQLYRRLLFQAYTHYQRGVYALLGGNAARAREQFALAADPQGLHRHLADLPADAPPEARKLLPVQRHNLPQQLLPAFGQYLPKYRELLDKYEAK